jgi:hypothetical protein
VTEERSQICKIKDCPGKIDHNFVLWRYGLATIL